MVITIITMIITCFITWHVPTSLSLHTLSIEVSTRVSSIIQNQTRPFSECQTALTGRRNSVPAASGEERPVLPWHDLKHRTLKPASGAHRPVQCRFATFSAHESGGRRTRPVPHKERPVTPRRADIARALALSVVVFFFFLFQSAAAPKP